MHMAQSPVVASGANPGMNIGKDLVAASSTPLVLAILAAGDSYGYAILKRVRRSASRSRQSEPGRPDRTPPCALCEKEAHRATETRDA